jgi:DNA (cytosine-5)-methyltransferase 1
VIDWTDMFAGAGGSSLGLELVPGMRVTQALNHWDLATEAHNANFPDADHDVHDVQVIPATRFSRTRCLWASPECTHHAYCRGPRADDPEAMRSRATFADIVRFTAHHRYDAIVVENVIEARLWCDKRGHGPRCSCGSTFDAWHQEMHQLGYESRIVYFNSQFALPTPQSRDRMYVVFWRHGIPAPNLDFRPSAWCDWCQEVVQGVQTWKPASKNSVRDQPGMFEWGRFGTQYVYTCPSCYSHVAPAVVGARTIIDWSLDAARIGDREKPLADKTRQRIKAGLERLAGSTAAPPASTARRRSTRRHGRSPGTASSRSCRCATTASSTPATSRRRPCAAAATTTGCSSTTACPGSSARSTTRRAR